MTPDELADLRRVAEAAKLCDNLEAVNTERRRVAASNGARMMYTDFAVGAELCTDAIRALDIDALVAQVMQDTMQSK